MAAPPVPPTPETSGPSADELTLVHAEQQRITIDLLNALETTGGNIPNDPAAWPARIEAFARAFARCVYNRPRSLYFDSAQILIGFATAKQGLMLLPALSPMGAEAPALATLRQILANVGQPCGHLFLHSELAVRGGYLAAPERIVVLGWSLRGQPDLLYSRATIRPDGTAALSPWTSDDPRLPPRVVGVNPESLN